MKNLTPVIPIILLTVLIIFLGFKKRNRSNLFHLDYIIIHLIVLLAMSFIYFGMINSIFPNSFFNLLNQLHIASVILFILHVESAIKGYRVRIRALFYYYFLLHLFIIVLNVFGFQIINIEANVKSFMLINIENASYFTDKIIIKGITLILLVFYLLKMCFFSIKKSYLIKKKNIYKSWVYSYSTFILIQLILNNLYYFGGFALRHLETVNIIIRINAILTLLFIFTNPTVLNYLPLIKKINIYNNVLKENYFQLLETVMKSEKLYLRKKLNIEEIAIKIGISVKKIRATIFLNTGKTFNDFINDYRIDKATKLIENGFLDKYTTSALGEKCGFNSHQTFFRAFRKTYGTTPRRYNRPKTL